MTSFDIIFVLVKISTSYHNKAICRRFYDLCLRVLRGDFFCRKPCPSSLEGQTGHPFADRFLLFHLVCRYRPYFSEK